MTAPVVLSADQFTQLLAACGSGNAQTGNAQTGGQAAVGSKSVVKPTRPSIDLETTESEWAVIMDGWERFKRMAKLTAAEDIRDNLRQCCSASVNKRLFDMKGAASLNAATEAELIQWIKDLAVKGVHKEVHRTQFVRLRQKQGENVTAYLGRLKSDAKLCSFEVSAPATCGDGACTCANHGVQVSYRDDMVATQLVAGLYNSDHLGKVLSESAELPDLESKFQRILLFEKSAASLTSLSGGDVYNNIVYVPRETFGAKRSGPNKKKKFPRQREQSNRVESNRNEDVDSSATVCPDCKSVHPKCRSCGGYHKCTTRCNGCKGMGHIKNCCPSAQVSTVAQATAGNDIPVAEEQEVAFGYAVTAEVAPVDVSLSVTASVSAFSFSTQLFAHMEFIEAEFRKTRPRDAPMLQVNVKVMVEVHNYFGKIMPDSNSCGDSSLSASNVDGLADTGAQVCTGGPDLLEKLGMAESFLITTNMAVKGMSQSTVTLMGALFLEISSQGIYTKQVVYIAREARSLILSETALRGLGVLPSNFPTVGMFSETPCADVAVGSSGIRNKCGCLLRTPVPDMPVTIPFEPVEANLPAFENWLKNVHFASSAFNTCEHQPIPTISGPDLVIRHKDDIEPDPVAIHSPIPIPHHWRKQVKQDLDRDVSLGVIAPVPANTPTTWCSRMIVTPKKDGTPRRVVDLQALNKVSLRETHHTPSPWQQVSSIPKNMKKTVLDAWNGYHSVPLDPKSCHKTTFLTVFGRYMYLRAVQGFKASGDAYTKRFDDITVGVPDVTRIVDDSCLYKPTIAENFWHTCEYITLCGKNGVIFNPKKLVFARDTIEFAGFDVTLDSLKPTRRMLDAIQNFPAPTNIKGVRAWFGLVNQVAYAFANSQLMAPFRELLRKDTTFYWDNALNSVFEQSKKKIVESVIEGVKMFSIDRTTCLATDWSRTGIGFFLLQKYCDCTNLEKAPVCGPGHWKLVFAGSRFLKDPETRYAPIEGEALAVVFALEQCRVFVLGCQNLIVSTDHRPLVPILNSKRLDLIKNPRLLDFKEKTLMYTFNAQHVKGALNLAADATSRHPGAMSCEVRSLFYSLCHVQDAEDMRCINASIVNSISALDDEIVTWDQVRAESAKDDICMTICNAIQDGFCVPKSDVEECLRPYYKLREELYSVEGVPFLNNRMHIPKTLRPRVLSILHSAHQGTTGMKRSIRDRFWWLGMDADINRTRDQCVDCNEMAPSNVKEPSLLPPEPEYPWQFMVMDYFESSGHHYLVAADRFTGWPEVYHQNGKLISLIRTCRRLFAHFGVPEEIASDGGPPFKSHEWPQFLKQWGIRWRLSSANFPQSNGRAELAVKTCKRMLQNNTDGTGRLDTAKFTQALLQYRNTPIMGLGMSPAYMLYGRQLRDALPSVPSGLTYVERYGKPQSVWDDIRRQREISHSRKQAEVVERYDRDKHPLTPLLVMDSVSIQNQHGAHPLRWDRTGHVVERLANRQYMVKCDGSGRVLLRNRAHLRKIDPSTRKSSSIDHPSPTSRKDAIGPAPLHVPDQLQDGTHILPPMDIDGEDISVGAGGEDISTTVTDNIKTVVDSAPVIEQFAPNICFQSV